MGRGASPLESNKIRNRAYAQYEKGIKVPVIAKFLGISERMVYRHIDAVRLQKAEYQVKVFNQALAMLDEKTLNIVKEAIRQVK